MYPIGGRQRPSDWVPTLVTGLDDEKIYFDANYSIEGSVVCLHVDVHALHKRL